MNFFDFTFHGAALRALPSGALWWPQTDLLCVSDLHLGKSERVARRAGQTLPPYDTRDTLDRLSNDLEHTNARTVICLGDSFDDLVAAQSICEDDRLCIAQLQAGRKWIWIEGNHDPGPAGFGGTYLHQFSLNGLIFRHVAEAKATAEVSGHYHPKARVPTRGRTVSRPAFLKDADRLILPAYGTYTGGLRSDHETLCRLMRSDALAILTGPMPVCVPMPRQDGP